VAAPSGGCSAAGAAIDFATLDINLAGQSSYPVASILRERSIPFLSATGNRSIALPAELNDSVVLAKPYSQVELASALYSARAA
jgi:hypothetical protein